MKRNLNRKFGGGLESSRSRTPDANAPSEPKHRPSLASRIDRALRVEANRRRMRLMDGVR